MAWSFPTYPDCPPGATEEETREWWNGFREQSNRYAERFNKDLFNRLFRIPKMPLIPTYDEMMEKYNEVQTKRQN